MLSGKQREEDNKRSTGLVVEVASGNMQGDCHGYPRTEEWKLGQRVQTLKHSAGCTQKDAVM